MRFCYQTHVRAAKAQTRLRVANAQSRQSLRYSHAQSFDRDNDSTPKYGMCASMSVKKRLLSTFSCNRYQNIMSWSIIHFARDVSCLFAKGFYTPGEV